MNNCTPSLTYHQTSLIPPQTNGERKRGLRSALTKARVARCVWTCAHSTVGVGEEQGWCELGAEANSHFPAAKRRQPCSVSCLGIRGFPAALQASTTWPRIHCGGAASADCGDRLLFSLCFPAEVRKLWAFVCGGSRVGVGFQRDAGYEYDYSSRMIRRLPNLLPYAGLTPFYSIVAVNFFLPSSELFGLVHPPHLAWPRCESSILLTRSSSLNTDWTCLHSACYNSEATAA